MKPIRFNPETDLAPLPFDQRHLEAARRLKTQGLKWHPHVGCFVWDEMGTIEAESPFPGNVYFILSMPRFLGIFGSLENMLAKLVWVPTWHQSRLIAKELGLDLSGTGAIGLDLNALIPGEELLAIYRLIRDAL